MSPSAVQSRPPRISRAAWMGELALGRSLRELCLPGTHDSGAYRLSDRIAPTAAQQPGLMRLASVLAGGDRYPARYRSLVRHMSVTQRRPVAEQLRDGIRLLDLRICACDGELWIHHGLLGPRLSEVLDDLASFVDGTDHELVVVRASHFTMGQGRDHHDVVSELLERFAGRLVPRGAEALTAPLGDLTADGSRLLWFYEPDDGNRVARDDRRFWPSIQSLYRERWCRHAKTPAEAGDCQGRAMASGSSPFHVWWTLTPQPGPILEEMAVRRLGRPGGVYRLEGLAERMAGEPLRRFLEQHARSPVGAVSVDFYDGSGVVPELLARMFGRSRADAMS